MRLIIKEQIKDFPPPFSFWSRSQIRLGIVGNKTVLFIKLLNVAVDRFYICVSPYCAYGYIPLLISMSHTGTLTLEINLK